MELSLGPGLISHYFPDLSVRQLAQFATLGELYAEWNAKINVISRKDFPNFYERHVLFSLGMGKVWGALPPNLRVMDVGTGGGFPAVPLAILYSQTEFTAVDSIGKKITVLNAVASALGLANVQGVHGRAEEQKGSFHYITGRAVTGLPELMGWARGKFAPSIPAGAPPIGLYYLRGNDFEADAAEYPALRVMPLAPYFPENEFLAAKHVLFLPPTFQGK